MAVWSELETNIILLSISYLFHEYEKFCVYSPRSMLAEAVHKALIAIDRNLTTEIAFKHIYMFS